MSGLAEIQCTHIEGELMRVRFASSQLISDHPAEWSGTMALIEVRSVCHARSRPHRPVARPRARTREKW